MTTPPRPPVRPDESVITSARHVSDDAVADALIRAVRGAVPDDPPSADRLRSAVVEYADAARARGETHERMLAAVRHLVTSLVTSASWSGLNRPTARAMIQAHVALASDRFYSEHTFRDAQPSTAFHFEVRGDRATPVPKTRQPWTDDDR